MEDTSFAIHPGNKKQIEGSPFHDIGNIISFSSTEKGFSVECEQAAVEIVFYSDEIVRIIMNPFEKPSFKTSFGVIAEPDEVKVSSEEHDGAIVLSTSKLVIKIMREPFRLHVFDEEGNEIVRETNKGMGFNEKKEVICYKDMEIDDHFYGFGEKTSFLDKRGEKMTMWNSDVYAPHNPEIDALYESIPYFMALRNGRAYGIFFDNTFKSVFDMKSHTDTYSFWAEGGQLDYYILAGPTPGEVISQYTSLTGRMKLPPKWALGYHQSRYSYESEQEVRELARNFIDKGIPIDAIYLDIHYMDGYRVFTFDKDRFPAPEKLIADLKEAGIHVVPIVDPGVKEDPEYKIYQEGITNDLFCKYMEGNLFFGEVWPGNSAFPDFTNTKVRNWWGKKHKFYTDMGIEGIWNDMNEPAVFNETKTMDVKVMHGNDGDPKTHREMHNLYGLLMGESTYNGMKELLNGNRPFLLTRAGYSGVQRYAAVWTGDNRSFWEHLAMALPMVMNLGVSGVPFTGPDVGGFAHDTTGELLIRWTQFGTFTPYFRNHSALDTVRQEPWAFGEEVEAITKKYIQQRYVWMPYLYTLFNEASKTGSPVLRPLVMEYPNDEHTFNLSDQFLVGENVLVAPILSPSTFHRVVYLPEGNWINYWTEEKIAGGKHVLVEASLDTLPIFIKEGSIIPNGTVKQSTAVTEEKLTLHVYPANEKTECMLYEDDGKTFDYENGKYTETKISCYLEGESLTINMENSNEGFEPAWKEIEFQVHQAEEDLEIILNGNQIGNTHFHPEERKITFTTNKS
ncbi:glycoside hydrolase family 31 protein [Pseudalkalibacillus caeni]|uniref:Glycoside hydrolase family 31 protein n=1 Tax=Exobacillus caeni TaxID=2574798 RepID=A0A5R9F4B3_9BACL|nr:glycoside hydrolase family 31 protein [Pseudalkalibacillus caeni]TLS37861.1 glycoside hydrolase family 31 protein [Pseudalkalibacillus caeni]